MPADRTYFGTLEEPAPGHDPVGDGRKTNGRAIAALVLGFSGLVIPLVPAILAVVFGHSARNDLRMDHTQKGDGLALTGIILGWIGIAAAAIGLIFLGFGGA